MDIEDGRVVTNFIGQALRGEALTIYGDGSQTRSFCYVDDLIRGIISLAQLPENPGTPVNLGNPNEFTIKELAHKIQLIFGSTIENKSLPIDDPLQRRPDVSLAKKLFGWEPSVQLDEGLYKTIEYFKSIAG
jgi:UDP-glucuronate decarboxylase